MLRGLFRQSCSVVLAPVRLKRLEVLAGLTRFRRWQEHFGQQLLPTYLDDIGLLNLFRQGDEEARAAAFEMLNFRCLEEPARCVKLVGEAVRDSSRYVRIRAVSALTWSAVQHKVFYHNSNIREHYQNSVGIERIVALLNLFTIYTSAFKDTQISDIGLQIPAELDFLQKYRFWFQGDWNYSLHHENELFTASILEHNIEIASIAGTARIERWHKQLREAALLAIRDEATAQFLLRSTDSLAYASSFEIYILYHAKNNFLATIQSLVTPHTDLYVYESVCNLLASSYRGTSHPGALELLDSFDTNGPSWLKLPLAVARQQILDTSKFKEIRPIDSAG